MIPIKNNAGAKVLIIGHKCYRCDHAWRPQNIDHIPKVCPKCKSPYWDRPKNKGGNNAKK